MTIEAEKYGLVMKSMYFNSIQKRSEKTGKIHSRTVMNMQRLRRKLKLKFTDRGSGGCNALDKNCEILPSCKLLICKHNDCNGVLRSSGN